MSGNANDTGIVKPKYMPEEMKSEFVKLTRVPKVALPTFCLAIACWISTVTLWGGVLFMGVPLWIGATVVGLVGYFAFSVIHDGIHRAIARDKSLNDIVTKITLALVVPWTSLEVFRWGHEQHHRHCGSDKDPDLWSQGPWYQLPFRWMVIDAAYMIYILTKGDEAGKNQLNRNWINVGLPLILATICIYFGYGEHFLWMFVIGSRLTLLGLGFAFFWLPHAPHNTVQRDNFTRASTVRLGFEKFFNVVLQYQNFHLIHHMYPATPFYRNGKIFHLIKPLLDERDMAIQHGFNIKPEILLRQSTA